VPSDLIRAIRRAAQGGKYVSDTLGERLAGQVIGERGKQPHESLSNKEYQVFQMIASGKSVKEIACQLSLARTTISSYRARILLKLNIRTNAELVRYALEHCLML
jgi:DNA-binding NarL/FixJ family response regulator